VASDRPGQRLADAGGDLEVLLEEDVDPFGTGYDPGIRECSAQGDRDPKTAGKLAREVDRDARRLVRAAVSQNRVPEIDRRAQGRARPSIRIARCLSSA
jgi:hypothetical protein